MYIIKEKNNKWILIKKDSKRATKTFSSKAEAVAYAEMKGYKYDIAGTKVDNIVRKAKKKPKVVIPLLIVLFLIIIGVFLYLHFTGNLTTIINSITKKEDKTEEVNHNGSHEYIDLGTTVHNDIVEDIMYDDFQIHFMMLGNDAAGDSVYIKAGETDILIDAGSESNSFTTTSAYINQYCKDKKLEYVIATHGDADHISAFPKFFQNYAVDTCIDFSCETSEQFQSFKSSGASSRSYFAGTTKTTATYGNYLKARDQYAKHHYTAGDCFKNLNGAASQYKLSDNVIMTILYNYYYWDNDGNNKADSTDENNFSVCTLFSYIKDGNSQHFILTGDLELEGEKKMAEYYDGSTKEKTLPEVELYKAGHHGSKTSSNDCLLKIIKPRICVVCCCAGTTEYTYNVQHQFPTQSFINHIAKYTSRVYVTTVLENKDGSWTHTAMNGNVIISTNSSNVGIKASNNLTKLKDSEWFNRKIYAVESFIYKDEENGDSFKVYKNCDETKTTDFYTKDTPNAVLINQRYWPSYGVS